MVASFVAHLRTFQVELNVHARTIAGPVKFTVDLHRRKVRILGIEGRSLVREGMKTRNFSAVDSVLCGLGLFKQSILSGENIFAGGFDAEEVANTWPETILPGDEVVFNAKIRRILLEF
jgi:hypothetical protein